MYNFGEYIPKIVMAVSSLWIVQRFWGIFFEKRKRRIEAVFLWGFYFIFQVYFQIDTGNPHISTIFINFFLIWGLAVCGYQSSKKVKCFLSIMLCTIWFLTETFTLALISGISMEHENLDVLGTIISKILMTVLVYTVSLFWNKKYDEAVPVRFYVHFLFLPLGSILIVLSQFYTVGGKFISMLSVSVLLLFNVIVFEIYMKMNELFLQEKEKILYARQSDIISANTEEQKKMIEDFHEEKHNLVNKLVVLKTKAENCRAEELIADLDRIIHDCDNRESICDSGNSTIDAIINFKYSVAKEFGIGFRLKIFVPEKIPIEQQDIGVILGNALDNAIEAVKECGSKERMIDISMGIKKSSWILVIKNPYEHEIERNKRGEILSSKKEKDRHGYGLKSIIKIAAKYQGNVCIDDTANIFLLTVVLNLGEF